ncbi:hypothetical protein H4W33_009780 [Kibdelosporangium phytohabitans]|nr:hypothetical protein [Kibdelosporangium phytohabitans]
MVPGWPYSVIVTLETGRGSWTAPLDAIRLGPGDDAASVTASQVRGVVDRLIHAGHWRPSDPDILLIADAGYDGPRLAHVLADHRAGADAFRPGAAPPRTPIHLASRHDVHTVTSTNTRNPALARRSPPTHDLAKQDETQTRHLGGSFDSAGPAEAPIPDRPRAGTSGKTAPQGDDRAGTSLPVGRTVVRQGVMPAHPNHVTAPVRSCAAWADMGRGDLARQRRTTRDRQPPDRRRLPGGGPKTALMDGQLARLVTGLAWPGTG